MLNRVNLVLSILLAIVVVVLLTVRTNYSQPNFQIILGDDMTYSPSYDAYDPNPNFANGRTLQSPVPGTLPRDAFVFHYEATPKEAIRAGEELTNPYDLIEVDKEATTEDEKQAATDKKKLALIEDKKQASTERGANIFKTYCAACHGGGGAGDGPVAKRGFPPPPSLLTGKYP